MKKLSLDLDQLRVESFATDQTEAGEGTVEGRMIIGSGEGCSVFYSCELSACGCNGGQGGSGHYTCGMHALCLGDSVELCHSDRC
jgi:hypothetical protein